MKFLEYLIEDKETFDAQMKRLNRDMILKKLKEIQEKCGYYIKLLKSNHIDLPFCRGSKGAWYQEKTTRIDRRSRGMIQKLADELNKILQQYGHAPRNKSIMATSDINHASVFGSIFYFFPIGPFKYTWIKCIDLNFTNLEEDLFNYVNIENEPDRKRNLEKEIVSNFYTNKSINIPYQYEYEIWFDCSKYILLAKDICDKYDLVSKDLVGK
jgi:hypothetical protein